MSLGPWCPCTTPRCSGLIGCGRPAGRVINTSKRGAYMLQGLRRCLTLEGACLGFYLKWAAEATLFPPLLETSGRTRSMSWQSQPGGSSVLFVLPRSLRT